MLVLGWYDNSQIVYYCESQMGNDTRPYRAQTRTYLQGTLLKLLRYHLENQDMKAAEYLRGLIRQDLTQRYEVNNTGGVVKIKR